MRSLNFYELGPWSDSLRLLPFYKLEMCKWREFACPFDMHIGDMDLLLRLKQTHTK